MTTNPQKKVPQHIPQHGSGGGPFTQALHDLLSQPSQPKQAPIKKKRGRKKPPAGPPKTGGY